MLIIKFLKEYADKELEHVFKGYTQFLDIFICRYTKLRQNIYQKERNKEQRMV